MKKPSYLFFLFLSALFGTSKMNAQCNWADRIFLSSYKDTCKNNVASFAGNVVFKNSFNITCLKCVWTVDGVTSSTKNSLNYTYPKNGVYNICFKVTDTCKNCDTVICGTHVVTCMAGGKSCDWASHNISTMMWDSCGGPGNNTMFGQVSSTNNSCFKYRWLVDNAIAGTEDGLEYPITKNGTYNVCVKIMDTCTGCDTLICKSIKVSCILGVEDELSDFNLLQLYPNPSHGLLQLDWAAGNAQYHIFNLEGRSILNGSFPRKGAYIIDLSRYPSGIYFIKVQTANTSRTAKIVVLQE